MLVLKDLVRPEYHATPEAQEKIKNSFGNNLEILQIHFPVDIGHDTQNTTFCQRLGLTQAVIPADAPVGFAPLSFRNPPPEETKGKWSPPSLVEINRFFCLR